MQIDAVHPIPLKARFDSEVLVVTYDDQPFFDLEDEFPSNTQVPEVSVTISDFTAPDGVDYAVFAYTRRDGEVVPWSKTGEVNTWQITMPSASATNVLDFAVVAIAVDPGEPRTRPPSGAVLGDPKIRITRSAGEELPR